MKKITPFYASLVVLAGVGLGAVSLVPQKSTAQSTLTVPKVDVAVRPVENTKFEPSGSLYALDESLSQLAAYAMPAVVKIEAESKTPDLLGRGPAGVMRSTGSGFVFRPDGYILTNDHVVAGADKVKVMFHDGRELTGTVTHGGDTDIAIVKVDAKDLPTLPLADSKLAKQGQLAMAIGSPFSFEGTVTIGHVSAVGRTITNSPSTDGHLYPELIQTDAAVNRGNSGGPLINSKGEVIGMNTIINSMTGGSNGVGFAISSNQMRVMTNLLLKGQKLERGFMGIQLLDLPVYRQKELGLPGGAVVEVAPSDSPGGIAGLQKGDIITKIGGNTIYAFVDVVNAMYQYGPGSSVDIEYRRNGSTKTTKAKLSKLTARPAPQDVPMSVDPDKLKEKFGKDSPFYRYFNPDGSDNTEDFTLPNPTDTKALDVSSPKLGVTIVEKQGLKGVEVEKVEPGSVAASIGIRAGDVIVSFDDEKVTSVKGLTDLIQKVKAGSHSISWTRTRPGANMTFTRSVEAK